MLSRWKKLSTKVQFENKYWKYLIDRFTIDGTKEFDYHYVHTHGSTMVIPKLSDDKFILVEQYRYLNDMFSIEFPCGSIEKGLTKLENAKKELIEETGYSTESLIEIGFFSPYNGIGDEICTIYYAAQLENSTSFPDETEKIIIHQLAENQVDQKIASNEIWDGMTISAWMFYKNYINGKK
jgi:ADP-ribose pyrophosphatase